MEYELFVDEVKMGKKGQITLPKKIRDCEGLKENDEFTIQHTRGGDIILSKAKKKTGIDRALEIAESFSDVDWDKAWEEVKAERAREHR